MSARNRSQSIRRLTQTALFAALTVLLTVAVRIPAGTAGGYLHIGDTVVYLAACCLPTPYAMAAGAIGGGLSDVLAGVPIWALASVPVKALLCLCFSSKTERLLTARNGLGAVLAGLITCGGYYVAEWCMTGNPAAALLSLYENAGQAAISAGLFVALALTLDKMKWKERLGGLQ